MSIIKQIYKHFIHLFISLILKIAAGQAVASNFYKECKYFRLPAAKHENQRLPMKELIWLHSNKTFIYKDRRLEKIHQAQLVNSS